MRNFTLATFYSPEGEIELKLFYLDGDAAFRATNQRTNERLLDEKVEGGGRDVAAFATRVEAVLAQFPTISRVGTFYDSLGSCYFKEEFSPDHLAVAVGRALAAA